jgi:hypothetical protein
MAALLSVSTAACVIRMPPPPTPTRRAPSATLPSQPPPAGEGRIVLETLDGPAVAHLVTGRASGVAHGGGQIASSAQVAVRRLCTTPCAVDLPLGEHEVLFSMDGTDKAASVVARIEERPQLLLTSMGYERHHRGRAAGGSLLISLAIPTIVTGGVFLAEDEGDTGGYVLAAGAAAMALGIYYIATGRTEAQDASYAQFPAD